MQPHTDKQLSTGEIESESIRDRETSQHEQAHLSSSHGHISYTGEKKKEKQAQCSKGKKGSKKKAFVVYSSIHRQQAYVIPLQQYPPLQVNSQSIFSQSFLPHSHRPLTKAEFQLSSRLSHRTRNNKRSALFIFFKQARRFVFFANKGRKIKIQTD